VSTAPTVTQAFGFSYIDARAHDRLIGATEGIDMLLADNNLEAIVAPTDNPAWPTDLINGDHFVIGSSSPAAIVGYPIINVPSGMSFSPPRDIILQHSLQRAHPDQAGLRLRSRDPRSAETSVPINPTLCKPGGWTRQERTNT